MYRITDRTWRRNGKIADRIQERLGYDIEIITISRPTAYGEFEPYRFVSSYEEFEKEASLL